MIRLAAIARPLRRASILLLAVGIAGAAGGCESAIGSPASVTLRYLEMQPLTRDRLVVTVDDLRSGWYFEGVDFEPGDDGWLVSRSLKLSASAGVRVTVSLRDASDAGVAAVAAGEITLPTTADEQWLVDIFPSALEPAAACAGCSGLARLTIAEGSRPTARDWLYVRWTGTGSAPTGPR